MLFAYSRFMDLPELLLLFPTSIGAFAFLRAYSSYYLYSSD